MRIGRTPTGPLNLLINRRSNLYTIYEEDGDTDDWNGSASLVSTNTSVNIDVHNQRTAPQQYPTGEEFETSLQGLVTVDEKTAEIANGNCIVHNGTVYEMTVDGWPDDEDPSVYVLELTERTDLVAP